MLSHPCSTYYVPGFTTDPTKCAVKDCGKPPPAGVLFSEATGCETVACTNAPPGWYYTPAQEERTAYLDSLQCPVARCNPPEPGHRFVSGFAADPNGCPTEECDRSKLPKGHYFELTDDYTKCTPTPCEAVPGHFYLHSAEGGQAGCAKVRSKCTNAKLGEKYAPQAQLVLSQTGCPVEQCSAPPPGQDFATKGSCADFVPCTTATAGQYYVSSSATERCQVSECTNANPGQFYKAGNTNTDSTCPVAPCPVVQGYTFRTAGTCSDMRRCAVRAAGSYFAQSRTEPCAVAECIHQPRGHWRFIPGFALRADKCPRELCTGDPPAAYLSTTSCDAAPTIPTTLATFVAAADRDEASPLVLDTTSIAVVVVVGVAIAVVMVIAVVWYCMRKRNTDVSKVYLHPTSSGIAASDLLLVPGDVTLGPKIAHGAGGQIFRGRFAEAHVALKESFDMMMGNNGEMAREAAMMTKLRHHNIVTFFGIWQPDIESGEEEETDRVFLVMELCPNGDLRDAAQDPESSLKQRQQWIMQVASAMEYLHGRTPPIVHRDLKPQNVLLDAKRDAKVCDFGTSKTMEKSRDMTAGIGTVAYMAPELMKAFTDGTTKVDIDGTKCDVFSFAVLALHVATGKAPHAGLSNEEIFLKVGMQGGRTTIPTGYAGMNGDAQNAHYQYFGELVKKMWSQQPEHRPTFDVIVKELEKVFSCQRDTARI